MAATTTYTYTITVTDMETMTAYPWALTVPWPLLTDEQMQALMQTVADQLPDTAYSYRVTGSIHTATVDTTVSDTFLDTINTLAPVEP